MNKEKILIVLSFLICTLCFSQRVLYKIDMEDQIENASLVVEAKVISKKSYKSQSNGHIYTKNTLKVYGTFKGEVLDTIEVITKGGSVGLEREVYRPSLQLQKNDLGLFVLEYTTNKLKGDIASNSKYKVVSSMQSFFEYELHDDTVTSPYYYYDSVSEFQNQIKLNTGSHEVTEPLEAVTFAAKSLEDPFIRSFAPTTIRAGINEEISLIGENFGDVQGEIAFRNADNGGSSFFTANSAAISSWSDTNVIVKVPSIAGTGDIRLTKSTGEQIFSAREITIISAEVNSDFPDFPEEEFRSKFINSDDNGGYTWTFNEDFYENTDAVDSFTRAVENWVCATSISWLISEETSGTNGSENDGLNLISFKDPFEDSMDELELGVLAVTFTYYTGCITDGEVTSYIEEVDITFSSDFNWNFGEGDPAGNENDFQGTATHELGHAHNLGHVIAPQNLMHFETDSGITSATREIDEDSKDAAITSYEFSKTPGLCDQKVISDRECDGETLNTNTLEVTDDEIRIVIGEDGILKISNSKSLSDLSLFDFAGRRIIQGENDIIDISNVPQGVYILFIEEALGDLNVRKIYIP